jgi:hypothetical protein
MSHTDGQQSNKPSMQECMNKNFLTLLSQIKCLLYSECDENLDGCVFLSDDLR